MTEQDGFSLKLWFSGSVYFPETYSSGLIINFGIGEHITIKILIASQGYR